MSVSSVGSGSAIAQAQFQQTLQSQQPAAAATPAVKKDADGDTDGDTKAADKGGLDVKG